MAARLSFQNSNVCFCGKIEGNPPEFKIHNAQISIGATNNIEFPMLAALNKANGIPSNIITSVSNHLSIPSQQQNSEISIV